MDTALTGAQAAARWGLDGFRGRDWPLLFCAPYASSPGKGILRTRLWSVPVIVDGVALAPVATVLRHIGAMTLSGRIDALDLVEFALEHALRDGMVELAGLTAGGGAQPGDALLRRVLARRPRNEPPTESYAETDAVQRFRSIGLEPWRQIPIIGAGRMLRADFMISAKRRRRPVVFRPSDGVLVEIDSREFHEGRFEEDHARETAYDALGFRWLSFTPNQIEHQWNRVAKAIATATGSQLRPGALTTPRKMADF